MTGAPPLNGLLIVDKSSGWTSMDVCAVVRTRLRRGGAPKRVKVGHGGTLDPLATGVLVVLAGAATRLSESVMTGRKVYEATIDLAHTSDTDDADGRVEPVVVERPPERARIDAALSTFVGSILQTPPSYSALHIGGRRAYELAREGIDLRPSARTVVVYGARVLSYSFPRLDVEISCGKGAYIRSIARDLGRALGIGGMIAALRRTEVGEWTIERARTLDEIPDVLTQADLIDPPAPT